MDTIMALLQWINDTSVAASIRESVWIFPTLETMHVLAIVLVVGAITRLDLRLLGLVAKNRRVTEVSDEMVPWAWIAFAVATVFGVLLWTSKPILYLEMAFFDVKLLLIALAGVNLLLFQNLVYRNVSLWDRDRVPPLPARAAGALSFAFWVSVVVCGRFIGFV